MQCVGGHLSDLGQHPGSVEETVMAAERQNLALHTFGGNELSNIVDDVADRVIPQAMQEWEKKADKTGTVPDVLANRLCPL
jgi:hypothetical protein